MALEDRIHDLEIETEAATKTIEHLRNQNPRKEVIMNDAPETTGEQGNEIIGVPMPELNDAIDLGLHQLRQAIEVGKSIARREVVIDIDAAEFLLGVVAACSSPEEDDADFAEVDESDGDLTAEIGDLNDVVASLENNIEGHISRVAKRDGTILELQEQIENNNDAAQVSFDAIVAERDNLVNENMDLRTAAEKKGKKKK